MKTKHAILVAFMASAIFISCNDDANENKESKTEQSPEKEVIVNTEYTCPKDCEKGKVYNEAGKCPTCQSALIVHNHVEGDGHSHSHEGEDGHSHEGDAKSNGHDTSAGHSHDDGHSHEH